MTDLRADVEHVIYYQCSSCARDAALRGEVDEDDCPEEDMCPLIAIAQRGEQVPWRVEGERTICLRYAEHGKPVPVAVRDDHTIDMFTSASPA